MNLADQGIEVWICSGNRRHRQDREKIPNHRTSLRLEGELGILDEG